MIIFDIFDFIWLMRRCRKGYQCTNSNKITRRYPLRSINAGFSWEEQKNNWETNTKGPVTNRLRRRNSNFWSQYICRIGKKMKKTSRFNNRICAQWTFAVDWWLWVIYKDTRVLVNFTKRYFSLLVCYCKALGYLHGHVSLILFCLTLFFILLSLWRSVCRSPVPVLICLICLFLLIFVPLPNLC